MKKFALTVIYNSKDKLVCEFTAPTFGEAFWEATSIGHRILEVALTEGHPNRVVMEVVD